MSLTKLMSKTMVCWCLMLGTDAVISAPDIIQKLGWCFFYSLFAAINWYFSERS